MSWQKIEIENSLKMNKIQNNDMGLDARKPVYRGFADNTGADQPAHPRSLISAFVIRSLKSIICRLAAGEISIIYLVFVAAETGLKLALSNTQKTEFLATRPTCEFVVRRLVPFRIYFIIRFWSHHNYFSRDYDTQTCALRW